MLRTVCLPLFLCGSVSAQFSPELFVTESSSSAIAPSVLQFSVAGPIGTSFGILVDVDAGPVEVLGERFELGFSPGLVAPFGGVINNFPESRFLTVPPLPSLAGTALFAQAVLLNPSAANGLFDVTNGESTVFHDAPSAIVDRFDNPLVEGFVGSFDSSVIGRIRGVFSEREVQPVASGDQLDPIDPTGADIPGVAVPFGLAIQNPLNPRGARAQFVYRSADLQGSGEPEVLTSIRWRAFDGTPVSFDQFDDVSIRLSHSDISPNYSVGSFSALPSFPDSGLNAAFAANPSSPEILVRSGPYTIDPTQVELLGGPVAGRYLRYGINSSFVYNGVDSLLVDVRTIPSASATGLNGAQVYLPLQSSARPNSRSVAALPPTQPGVLDPNAALVGNFVDNAIHDVILGFARVEADALSPFRDSGSVNPDYDSAILAAQLPGNSSVQICYRGADDQNGTNATAFDPNVDLADGKRYLQYVLFLTADLQTGEIPSVDSLVIPVR